MLLNEFLKEHRKSEQALRSGADGKRLSRTSKSKQALTAEIQKVSAQLEASKPAPQVGNNP